jgi:hypothetical protein
MGTYVPGGGRPGPAYWPRRATGAGDRPLCCTAWPPPPPRHCTAVLCHLVQRNVQRVDGATLGFEQRGGLSGWPHWKGGKEWRAERGAGARIHCTACQAVTSHTSSIAPIVSRNSSKPSLWCGVVNLGAGSGQVNILPDLSWQNDLLI